MSEHARPDLLPTAVLLVGSTLWGLMWIPLKLLVAQGMDPVSTTLVAYLATAALTLPVAFALARGRPLPLKGLVALAFFGGASAIFFISALMEGSVVRAMMLFFLIPAWGVIFGRIFLGERLGPARIVAVLLALAGAFLILGPTQIVDARWQWADLFAVLAGLTLAVSNVIFRYLSDCPIPVKLFSMQLGSLVFAGLAVLLLGAKGLAGAAPPPAIAGAALYGVTILLAAMVCTQFAVNRLPVGRVAILMTLELVVSVGSATIVGGERPAPIEWTGGLLILAAALVEARRRNDDPAGGGQPAQHAGKVRQHTP
ncbi:MAG: DMT family transporter [Halothiobacillaceae bacterium]